MSSQVWISFLTEMLKPLSNVLRLYFSCVPRYVQLESDEAFHLQILYTYAHFALNSVWRKLSKLCVTTMQHCYPNFNYPNTNRQTLCVSMHTLVSYLKYPNSQLSKYFCLVPARLDNWDCTIYHNTEDTCI